MDACAVPSTDPKATFQELYDDMGTDAYWIRFFVRPCCPAPGLDAAMAMLDKLAAEAAAREDFTPEERERIIALIEGRKEWYPRSGLYRGAAK